MHGSFSKSNFFLCLICYILQLIQGLLNNIFGNILSFFCPSSGVNSSSFGDFMEITAYTHTTQNKKFT